ncbi:DUF4352 domain-containing protein [Nocardiopsis terrae]
MSTSDPRPPSPGRVSTVVRVLAIPVAVIVAGAAFAVTLLALSSLSLPNVQVVLGEEESSSGPASAPESPEQGEPGAEEAEPEEAEPEPAPEPVEPRTPAEPDSVPPSSYDGATTAVGVFRVHVETAYTDSTVTNGRGSHAEAPSGWEYHVYRLNVTNEGSSPAIFDSSGTVGTTTDGRSFGNDIDAEHTVAYDYFWGEIAPGATVTTHIMFLAPVGTEFAHVLVSGQSDLRPG